MRAPPGGSHHRPCLQESELPDHPAQACCPETRNAGRGVLKAGQRQRRKARDTAEGVLTIIINA